MKALRFLYLIALGAFLANCSQSSLVNMEERIGTDSADLQTNFSEPPTFTSFQTAFRSLNLPLEIPALDSGWVIHRTELPAEYGATYFDNDPNGKYYALGQVAHDSFIVFLIRKTVKHSQQYYAKIYMAIYNQEHQLVDSELIGGYESVDFEKVPLLIKSELDTDYTEAYKTWRTTISPDFTIVTTSAYEFNNPDKNQSTKVIKATYSLAINNEGLVVSNELEGI
jgi:hypothetical protein